MVFEWPHIKSKFALELIGFEVLNKISVQMIFTHPLEQSKSHKEDQSRVNTDNQILDESLNTQDNSKMKPQSQLEGANLYGLNSWTQTRENELFLPSILIPACHYSFQPCNKYRKIIPKVKELEKCTEIPNQDHDYSLKRGPDHSNESLAKRFKPSEKEENVPEIDSERQKSESDLNVPSVLSPELIDLKEQLKKYNEDQNIANKYHKAESISQKKIHIAEVHKPGEGIHFGAFS